MSEYRKTIPFFVKQGDDLIEVGCHCGTTTALLYEAVNCGGADLKQQNSSGFCVGVDIGKNIIASAKKKCPHIVFEVVDAWKTLDPYSRLN